jgi:hypothetical protein
MLIYLDTKKKEKDINRDMIKFLAFGSITNPCSFTEINKVLMKKKIPIKKNTTAIRFSKKSFMFFVLYGYTKLLGKCFNFCRNFLQ